MLVLEQWRANRTLGLAVLRNYTIASGYLPLATFESMAGTCSASTSKRDVAVQI